VNLLVSINDVIRAFWNKNKKPVGAGNVMYTPSNGGMIVGYGWAVYARRKTVYTGWRGYSSTTSKHITLITRAAPGKYSTSSKRPQVGMTMRVKKAMRG